MLARHSISQPHWKSSGIPSTAHRAVEPMEKGRREFVPKQATLSKSMPCLTLVELSRLLQNLQARLWQTEQTPIVCIHCAYASTTCTHHRRRHFAVAKTGKLVADSQSDYLTVLHCCCSYSFFNCTSVPLYEVT